MLYVKEKKDIEVGGANITIDGKKINKADQPANYDLIQSIRKEYPDLFKQYGIDFDKKFPDVIINGGDIIINDENGKELLKKKIADTKLIKEFYK